MFWRFALFVKKKESTNVDLFEDVKAMCGCAYISDIAEDRQYNKQARVCVYFMRLEEYDLHVLTDMYQYLTGNTVLFETAENAKKALCELKGTA